MIKLQWQNFPIISVMLIVPLMVCHSTADAANPEDVQRLKTTKRCERCDLSGANLSGLDLSGAKVMDSDLTNANLSGANLVNAELMIANASRANFAKARLTNANLSGTVFVGANLSYADIRGANISQANFERAKLSGILTSTPIRLPNGQVVGPSSNSGRTMPSSRPNGTRRVF